MSEGLRAVKRPRADAILRRVAVRIGVDIGGTFTDLVSLDEATGAVANTKALSTPRDLLEGVLRCVDQAGVRLADCRLVIHGTTIGINALLERKGALTGLITTQGFRDVLEIGRETSSGCTTCSIGAPRRSSRADAVSRCRSGCPRAARC